MTWQELVAFPAGLFGGWGLVQVAGRFGAKKRLRVLAAGLLVAALVYVAAAIVRGTWDAIVAELFGLSVFGLFTILGLRRRGSERWLSVGWTLHVGWDLAGQLGDAPLLPLWYAILCLSFDLVVAYAIVRGPCPEHLEKAW